MKLLLPTLVCMLVTFLGLLAFVTILIMINMHFIYFCSMVLFEKMMLVKIIPCNLHVQPCLLIICLFENNRVLMKEGKARQRACALKLPRLILRYMCVCRVRILHHVLLILQSNHPHMHTTTQVCISCVSKR
jgi:hypothetical protein